MIIVFMKNMDYCQEYSDRVMSLSDNYVKNVRVC